MLKLEELEIYQMAMDIGEEVWNLVDEWKPFAKRTVTNDNSGNRHTESFKNFRRH